MDTKKNLNVRGNYRLVDALVTLDSGFPINSYEWRVPDSRITFLHTHNTLELGYCLGGAGLFTVGSKVFTYSEGFVSIIVPGEAHLASTIYEEGSPWIFIDTDPLRLLAPWNRSVTGMADTGRFSHPDFPNIIGPDTDPEIPVLIRSIAEEIKGVGLYREHVVRGLMLALMARLHRLADRVEATAPSAKGTLGRIAPAVAFISSHYQNDISVDDIAGVCGLSPSQLRRNFNAVLGRSPQEYLDKYRVGMAAVLLKNTDLGVLEISEQVGFGSVSTMNRRFKAETGISPAAWRRGSVRGYR